ncbi:hypothetical protein JOQ06_002034, partial [Pogonophryne albipinna]
EIQSRREGFYDKDNRKWTFVPPDSRSFARRDPSLVDLVVLVAGETLQREITGMFDSRTFGDALFVST